MCSAFDDIVSFRFLLLIRMDAMLFLFHGAWLWCVHVIDGDMISSARCMCACVHGSIQTNYPFMHLNCFQMLLLLHPIRMVWKGQQKHTQSNENSHNSFDHRFFLHARWFLLLFMLFLPWNYSAAASLHIGLIWLRIPTSICIVLLFLLL